MKMMTSSIKIKFLHRSGFLLDLNKFLPKGPVPDEDQSGPRVQQNLQDVSEFLSSGLNLDSSGRGFYRRGGPDPQDSLPSVLVWSSSTCRQNNMVHVSWFKVLVHDIGPGLCVLVHGPGP